MLCRAYVYSNKVNILKSSNEAVIINKKLFKLILITLVVVMLVFTFYFYTQNKNRKQQIISASRVNVKFGLTGSCRAVPKFISPLKMKAPSLDSRQKDGVMGLQIRDFAQKEKTWQHPSWVMTGYIGTFDRDRQGNVYVFPLPYVSLKKNPPEKQNQVYIIDAETAKISLFMKLPANDSPNAKNPFGVTGLYYDCDTDSLYVSSLAGSKPMQEKGVIYQIDVKTKTILSKLEGIDAMGIGVFNTPNGKRLYFGSARDSGLYSIALDNQGHFTGEKKYELSLSQIKGGDSTIIKKIIFKEKNNKFYMSLKEIEFGFRLLAENKPYQKRYNFEWDIKTNKWVFSGFSKE